MNMTRKFQKTVEAIVYLANKDNRLYWILKMIWLAERKHLERYGKPLIGDTYIAMSHGPVPSLAYDIAKDARGGNHYSFSNPRPQDVLDAPNNYTLRAKRKPQTEILSQSAMECLDEAYSELKDFSFQQVKAFSHTPAYEKANQADVIPFDEFVKELANGEQILDYLNSL